MVNYGTYVKEKFRPYLTWVRRDVFFGEGTFRTGPGVKQTLARGKDGGA